jgi:hypothetical protein
VTIILSATQSWKVRKWVVSTRSFHTVIFTRMSLEKERATGLCRKHKIEVTPSPNVTSMLRLISEVQITRRILRTLLFLMVYVLSDHVLRYIQNPTWLAFN